MLPEDDLNAQYYRLRAQQISNRHTLENYQRYGALAPVLAEFSSLCSGFLHDLGNGLNAIQGKLESLSLEPLDPQQAHAVARAKSLCIVCGWRMYALAEISPSAPMHPEPANLPESIPRLLDALAAAPSLSVRTVFHTAVPRLIVADYDNALRLAWVEPLLNAFQAVPNGGQVTVSVQRLDGKLAQIEIADTGAGLPAQDPEECFDLRFTTRPHRYGLGLYVARRVVEKHRGTFTLLSETGPGTRVMIQLPTGNPEPDWDDEDALARELEVLHDAVAEQEREIEACQLVNALSRKERLDQLSGLFGQLGAPLAQFVETGLADIRRGLAPLADQITGQAANSIRLILEKCDYCRAVLGNVRALDSDYAIRREPVDLNQIAAQAVRLMAWRAQPGTQLHLAQAESLPVVKADELLVTTALVNLLRNALDAAGRNGQVEVETAFACNAVAISVTNTGATIPPDVRPPIGPFSTDLTCRLIQEPVAYCGMHYQPDALEAILRATGGHPYLVQLLCGILVDRRNRQRRNEMTVDDVQIALEAMPQTSLVQESLAQASQQEEVASLQRQLSRLKSNILALQEKRVEFVDPRSVPSDLAESEKLTRDQIARIQSRLAELGAE